MTCHILPVCLVEGLERLESTSDTYLWESLLADLQWHHNNVSTDGSLVLTNGDAATPKRKRPLPPPVIPASAFYNAPLADFMEAMKSGNVKVEVRIYDYDEPSSNTKSYWLATIYKVYGYMLLLRFEGMDRDGDEKYDFWINAGSADLRPAEYCSTTLKCELVPPKSIQDRQSDWHSYVLNRVNATNTLSHKWPVMQRNSIVNGRFKVNSRLELLDRLESTRIRPARVINQMGRRICVRVSASDMCKEHLKAENDAQMLDGVWLDESSNLLFPVGWAAYNRYGLQANEAYIKHSKAIANALRSKQRQPYAPFDVTFQLFRDWTENKSDKAVHWQVGWKLECLDPLNSTFLELRVATCVELLQDGFIKLGFDGPEMEEESLPIHSTSPLLFPVGYGAKYNVNVRGPDTSTEFSWNEYLMQCQATAAPEELFDPIPPPEALAKFQIGGKLEAVDMCEPNLICPATIVAIKGRLLRVHYDGWDDDMDQMFDYRSRDILPIGWCQMYGYHLEHPKNDKTSSAKK